MRELDELGPVVVALGEDRELAAALVQTFATGPTWRSARPSALRPPPQPAGEDRATIGRDGRATRAIFAGLPIALRAEHGPESAIAETFVRWQCHPVSIAELEATLQRTFAREYLTIYADALQSRGEPRGELIAIDLHKDAHGATAELAARRRELIAMWLGELGTRPFIRTRYGFVYVVDAGPDELEQVLASLASDHLRGVDTSGLGVSLEQVLQALARAPRPWLTTLRLEAISNCAGAIVSPETAADVIRATPWLEQLEVNGPRVLGEFVHPSVRHLRITGHDAIGSLAGRGPAWPRVAALDFAFHSESGGTPKDVVSRAQEARRASATPLTSMLPVARLPALRRFDLSRNEPGLQGEPNYFGGSVDVYRFLRDLECRSQLAYLRLPSLRSEQQLADAQTALSGMRALVEVNIAREYGHGYAVRLWHPSAKIVVSPASWPPLDLVSSGQSLVISVPGADGLAGSRHEVSLGRIVRLMEHSYARFPADVRAAWDEFWRLERGERSIPSGVLTRAIEPVSFGLFRSLGRYYVGNDCREWAALRDKLRAAGLAPDTRVSVHRGSLIITSM